MPHDDVPMVRLKNGDEVPRTNVFQVMEALESLQVADIMSTFAFVELVNACRNPNHQLEVREEEILVRYQLITGATEDKRAVISAGVRSIVLSAVKGEGVMMTLESPIAPE